jgi:hypothetical protein
MEPFAKDGLDSEENLITACNKCNGRKSASLLEVFLKWPMRKPIKGKYGEPQHWDGLASLFLVLAERNELTTGEKVWLRVLKATTL